MAGDTFDEGHQQQGQYALEHMLRYASMGWHVFPQHYPLARWEQREFNSVCSCRDPNCRKPGKHPMAKTHDGHVMVRGGFNGATTDSDEIRRWVRNDPRINVGVTTGLRSGIVVVDFDRAQGKKDMAELEELHPGWMEGAPTVITGNGVHVYFAHPGAEYRIPSIDKVLRPGTDIKGDGGCVTVPPSTHESLKPYYWTARPEAGLPVLPSWILDELDKREKDRERRREERRAQMVDDPSTFSEDDKFRQCERYMAKVGPAIEGQGGDRHTFTVACIGGDFDLPPERFMPLLERWNSTCVPPWDYKDLKEKLRSAEKSRSEPRGCKLRRARPRTVTETRHDDKEWNDPVPDHVRDLGDESPRLQAAEATVNLGPAHMARNIGPRDGLLLQDFLTSEYLAEPLATDGHPLSERGNASRFVGAFRGRVKYCAVLKLWYVWTGTHWEQDRVHAVQNLASQVMARMHLMLRDDAYNPKDGDSDDTKKRKLARRRELVRHIKKSEQPKQIKPALEYVSWERSTSLLPEQMDKDDNLVNTPTGVVDIKDLGLYAHDPELHQTKITQVGYDKHAECPEWEDFVLWAMNGDRELASFLQRAAGMSLTGYARDHCFLVLYGIGGNGKSTFVNCLKHIGYKYARVFPFDMFLSAHRDSGGTPNEELLALKDVRMAFASEPNENKSLNESRIKSITGGEPISARPLYGRPIEFEPKFTLWLSCNHKPVIKGTDDGIWRRVMLVPFDAQVTEETKDTGKQERMLEREAEGILGWALRGAKEWYRHGLQPPKAVKNAVKEYREDMDTLGKFIAQRCILSPGIQIKSSDLYKAYEEWAEQEGERFRMSHKRLTQKLKERGVTVDKGRQANVYVGITLKGS